MKIRDTKQKIIETASELFYKNGYNLTGINEIIAEAGIAKATLYSHFKSKEDICIAYLKYKNETFLEEIESYCKSKPKGKAQVIAIFDFLNSFFRSDDFNGCWCLRTVAEIPKDNKRIKTEIQNQKKGFLDLITSLLSNNISANATAIKNLSRQFYLLYESAVAESHLHEDNWPVKSAKQLANQLI